MKGRISIISGILIGFLISYFTLDYSGSEITSDGKILSKVNELDFSFISNAFIIIVITSGVIYYLLTKLDNNEQKQYNSRN
jgi:prolipoprotein diacylglyceryltransferase